MATGVTVASIEDRLSRCFEYFALLPDLAEDESRLMIWRGHFEEPPNDEISQSVLQLVYTLLDQIFTALVNVSVAAEYLNAAHRPEAPSAKVGEDSEHTGDEDSITPSNVADDDANATEDALEGSDDLHLNEDNPEHSDEHNLLEYGDEESRNSGDDRDSGSESDNDSLWGSPDPNDDVEGHRRLLHENLTQLLRLCQAPICQRGKFDARYNADPLTVPDSLLDALQAQEAREKKVPSKLTEVENPQPDLTRLILSEKEFSAIFEDDYSAPDPSKGLSRAAQIEQPEKCPISTCEYHTKGFARKSDENKHTLTHYQGTMVCGFCPSSSSAAKNSFNRVDLFKRHLTSVHDVEQTPPNARVKHPPVGTKKHARGVYDVPSMCSTCGTAFFNAGDFYEHLDNCILHAVQQSNPPRPETLGTGIAVGTLVSFEPMKNKELKSVAILPHVRLDSTDNSLSLQAQVTAILSIYREASQVLDTLKFKYMQNEKRPPTRSLEESLAQTPGEIEREYQKSVGTFGVGVENDSTGLHLIAEDLREGLLGGLRDAANNMEKDIRHLFAAAETGRDRVIEALCQQRQRLFDVAFPLLLSTTDASERPQSPPRLQQLKQKRVPDSTGQIQPPGRKPWVTAMLWEDEGTLCFIVEADGVDILRREDNHMINATKLLTVPGMTRDRRDAILECEKTRHVVKSGPPLAKGVWIPFERALDLANKQSITEMLYPLFLHDIGSLLWPDKRLSSHGVTSRDLDSIARKSPPPAPSFLGSIFSRSEPERQMPLQTRLGKTKDRLWTEIPNDLVIIEALAELDYEWELTDQYFYVSKHLSSQEVQRLVKLTEGIRKIQHKRVRNSERERGTDTRMSMLTELIPPLPWSPPEKAEGKRPPESARAPTR